MPCLIRVAVTGVPDKVHILLGLAAKSCVKAVVHFLAAFTAME